MKKLYLLLVVCTISAVASAQSCCPIVYSVVVTPFSQPGFRTVTVHWEAQNWDIKKWVRVTDLESCFTVCFWAHVSGNIYYNFASFRYPLLKVETFCGESCEKGTLCNTKIIGSPRSPSSNIGIYPNPSGGSFTATWIPEGGTKNFTLFNSIGEAVGRWSNISGNSLFVSGFWSSGMYLLRPDDGGESAKVVIQR